MMYEGKDKKTKLTRAERKKKRKLTKFTNEFVRHGLTPKKAALSAEALLKKT